MLKNMKKYSGQAIAIIMIVLVVATVVGASLYSRMIRNTGEIVDTRESQRALEQADSILDVFVSADLPMVQGLMSSALATNNPTKFNTISDLEAFLNNGDGVNDIDITILEEVGTITGWCEPPESGSSLEVTVSYGDQNSVIEYNVGDVIAINTWTAFSIRALNAVQSCLATYSDSVGKSAVAMVVPIIVSGTCIIHQPYVKADTAPTCSLEARLSCAKKIS